MHALVGTHYCAVSGKGRYAIKFLQAGEMDCTPAYLIISKDRLNSDLGIVYISSVPLPSLYKLCPIDTVIKSTRFLLPR